MSNSYRPNRQYISGNPACGGHYHALPLTDVLRIHKRKYREPGKVEYGTAIYRCPVLLGQISVAARSLLSLAAMKVCMRDDLDYNLIMIMQSLSYFCYKGLGPKGTANLVPRNDILCPTSSSNNHITTQRQGTDFYSAEPQRCAVPFT